MAQNEQLACLSTQLVNVVVARVVVVVTEGTVHRLHVFLHATENRTPFKKTVFPQYPYVEAKKMQVLSEAWLTHVILVLDDVIDDAVVVAVAGNVVVVTGTVVVKIAEIFSLKEKQSFYIL